MEGFSHKCKNFYTFYYLSRDFVNAFSPCFGGPAFVFGTQCSCLTLDLRHLS